MDLLSLEEITASRLVNPKDAPVQQPIVTIGGAPFAMTGDFSIIGGQPKSGKSSLATFILYTALHKSPAGDTLTIRSIRAPEGKKVIYIDTEQSQASTYKLLKTLCTLLGTETAPDNLDIHNLRERSPLERKHFIESLFHHYPDIHLVIIDGIADLVTDPNKVDESNALICWLMAMGKRHNTAIIGYLHENPGTNNKLRGNLGSEAERKAYACITLQKDKEGVHSCIPKFCRGEEPDKIYFRYDKTLGRMVSLSPDDAFRKAQRDTRAPEDVKKYQLVKLAAAATNNGTAKLTYQDLADSIRSAAANISARGMGERTAKTRIKEMQDKGILSKLPDGTYEYVFTKSPEDVFAS